MHAVKKIILLVALIVAIAIAIFFAVKSALRMERPTRPDWSMRQPVELIDKDSFEVVTMTDGERLKLPKQNGYYKNPKTGTYTLTRCVRCANCGEKVPMPPVPEDMLARHNLEEIGTWAAKQICPKCKKPIRGGGPGPGRP